MSVRRILGLDLGTTTGWCRLLSDHSLCTYGEWKLAGNGDGLDRVLALRDYLDRAMAGAHPPDAVAYEEVQFVVSLKQISLWVALATVLRIKCRERGVPLIPVAPGTLKKWATGDGRADKDAMVAQANLYLHELGLEPIGKSKHDVADAIHIARWAAQA